MGTGEGGAGGVRAGEGGAGEVRAGEGGAGGVRASGEKRVSEMRRSSGGMPLKCPANLSREPVGAALVKGANLDLGFNFYREHSR